MHKEKTIIGKSEGKMNKLPKSLAAACAAVLITVAPARASDVDILINKLVERNILTRIDADAIRAEMAAERKPAAAPENQAFADSIKASSYPWLENLTQKGDLRLRYDGNNLENEDGRDRNRWRFRLRWGLEKKLHEDIRVGFRLASGTDGDPSSTNQSFDDEFDPKSIFIDRAYAVWTPLPNAEIGGGKVANPFEKWGTALVWDADVNPEGAYERIDFKIADVGEGGRWDLQTIMGQFAVNENSTGQDSDLFAYGAGTNIAWDKSRNIQLSFVYYDWQDYAQLLKSGSVLINTPSGNDTEVDSFKVASFYAEHNMPVPTFWGDKNLKLFGHYIHNTDEGEETDGNPQTPNGNRDDGYSAGLQLGQSKKKGDWQARYQYFYLEANATPGNFSESDLGLGGTNQEGHTLQYGFRLLDSLELVATYSFAERLDRTAAGQDQDREVHRWLLDAVYSF